VQLYTGFIYQGPRIAQQIGEDLLQILAREGFPTLDAAVGNGGKKSAL
jgi:dihydroorotate dehydrogenase